MDRETLSITLFRGLWSEGWAERLGEDLMYGLGLFVLYPLPYTEAVLFLTLDSCVSKLFL